MDRLFLECAIRAALLVGGTAIVLYVMRIRAAAARHRVWTVVVLLMLVLPIWMAWGPKASLRLLPQLAQANAHIALPQPVLLATNFPPSALISSWQAALLGIYLSGLCLLLFRLAIGTFYARKLVREAALHDRMRTSPLCAAPVTVGFFRPTVIFPEHCREWSRAQRNIVCAHESEHARRRDPLVQWLALLNRALFWFHPAAWWLERHLSALAEEACDGVVLARGHNPREYAEYLLDIAGSVARSGTRLNVAGMAMPGSFLPQRIRKIMEGAQVPQISRARIACVAAACTITWTAFAAGTLEHARLQSSPNTATASPASAVHSATKFVLGDLRIEGDIHDRDGVRDRVLKAWKDREYDDVKQLQEEVLEVGVRVDFQERGYFKVVVNEPISQPLGLTDGKQRILLVTPVTEGDQFRLGNFTIQNAIPNRALNIPTATLREQFHLRKGDLFSVPEIRAGLDRISALYGARGYPDFTAHPVAEISETSHHIDLTLRITEGPRKP